jgi:hypothetical protein
VTEYKQLLQVCAIEYAFGRSLFSYAFQFHMYTSMVNDIAGILQALLKSGRPVKYIRAHLNGKSW